MFQDPVIVCDECDAEGCLVEEVFPKKPTVSMEEYAKSHKQVMDRFSIQHELHDRIWTITCLECGHVHKFTEYARPPVTVYNVGKNPNPPKRLKVVTD